MTNISYEYTEYEANIPDSTYDLSLWQSGDKVIFTIDGISTETIIHSEYSYSISVELPSEYPLPVTKY